MKVLTDKELNDQLGRLRLWVRDENSIKRDFRFGSFTEAFSFMTAVALNAEKMDHHPDWTNVYDKVSIVLSTHSAGGITMNDIELALRIEEIYDMFESD